MSTNTNTTTSTEQSANTHTPEAAGGQGERLFTQSEVNAIVQDRLAREREKIAKEAEQDSRERDLERRELALKAKEDRATKTEAVKAYYEGKGIMGKALDIAMKGSAQEIDALELTDGQVKDFSTIDGLIGGVFSGLVSQTVTRGADVPHPPVYGNLPDDDERIANAFKPKI